MFPWFLLYVGVVIIFIGLACAWPVWGQANRFRKEIIANAVAGHPERETETSPPHARRFFVPACIAYGGLAVVLLSIYMICYGNS